MGVSFKKSIKLTKNTRINISKDGGIGFSTGFKGFRISKNSKGTKITVGRGGVYWSKFFSRKKKKAKGKKDIINSKKNIDQNEELELERIIDPETDFEKLPTEEEQILLYLGNREKHIILYFLLALIIGLAVLYYFNGGLYVGMGLGLSMLLTLFYIFISKYNNYINDLNRAIKLFDRDRYDKCFKLLDRCLKTKPKSKKALLLMIFTTFKLEKFEESFNFIVEYKSKYEVLEVIYFIEAFCLSELNRYEEAISAIENVYSEDKEVKNAKYKILGDCYLGLGNYQTAINWFEQLPVNSKEMDDSLVEFKYSIGKAYLLSGNKKKAFNYLAKVYDYRANFKDVKQLMAESQA